MSNTEQKQKILLKRTTEVDRPSIPSGASHGELFLNIASGANAHNKISTMQIGTNNPIIWSDDVANEKKFALKTEVEALVKEVEDNELVTATAISTMNTSAGFNDDGSSVLEGGVSLSQAIIDLQARAGVIEESDPIFAKSAASGITSADITNWNNKMDAVDRISSAHTSYSADTSVSAKTSVSATTSLSATTSVSASTSVSATTSVSAKTSISATTSTKAIQDGDGNVITTTYSTKAELSGAVNDIIEEIIDNELVTSTAISTMNASAGFNEDGSSVLEGGVSLSEAIIELQNKTQDQGNYYFYLNESGELASDTISDEEIEKLKNSKNIYVIDNSIGSVFNCDFTASVSDTIVIMGSVTTVWGTTFRTKTVYIGILTTENKVVLDMKEFDVTSSYLLNVEFDVTTGVIANKYISLSEIEKIRKADVVIVKTDWLEEGERTFSCSKNDANDSLIILVGSQVHGHDGFWTNTSNILSLTILIDTTSNTYSGQIYNIVTGEHSKLADSATTSISATTADKAYKDGSGNVISSTYASKDYVKEIASGGIKFKGIVSVLPWEGVCDESDFAGSDFEVGDLIIVAPNVDTSIDPSMEYILTRISNDGNGFLYHWELLGETTVVDKRITDEINRAKAAEDEIRKHRHGKIILSGDVSGETVIKSGITDNILNVTVKDDSHQHTRFANMVHFDNDIHLCNNGGNIGGTIYFGDNVDENGTRYTYITERRDDGLDFVSRDGFAFSHYIGYEALVSIRKTDGEEIHVAFNKTLSDDELFASSEIVWRGNDGGGENIEIKSNQIRLNTSIINLNGNSTFKSHGDIKFNVNRLLCNNKEVAVKNDIYNVINFRGVIDEYPWEYESINNNYNIRDVIAYTPIIEGGEGSGGSEDVLEKRDYELYIKIDNNIWAPLGGAGKNEGVDALLDLIEENEFVTSNALNRITASAGFNVNGESTLPNRQSLTEAIVELQNAVGTGPNAGGGSSLSLVANTGNGKYYLLGQADTSSNAQGVYKNAKVYMNNGRLYSESDKTLKTHIDHVNGDPELIKQIPKVYYHWKDDETKETQMGTYAQDLEKVYPELVATGEDGIKAVAYDKLGVVALAGIDKLYEIVQQLQAKNEELEKRIKELENK